jgi:hypothetical protein
VRDALTRALELGQEHDGVEDAMEGQRSLSKKHAPLSTGRSICRHDNQTETYYLGE